MNQREHTKKSGNTLIVSRCKFDNCNQNIFWVRSAEDSDKRMPINFDGYQGPFGVDLVYDKDVMVSHWDTCKRQRKANRHGDGMGHRPFKGLGKS